MDPLRTVLGADILVDADGRIADLAPPGGDAAKAAQRSIDASGLVIVPGLVQAHLHLCQTLFRGLAEDRPLLAWLRECIWPLEAAHDPDFDARVGAVGHRRAAAGRDNVHPRHGHRAPHRYVVRDGA
jgi:cytosine/adenosine deaminase-related metal-dependent hydrolase